MAVLNVAACGDSDRSRECGSNADCDQGGIPGFCRPSPHSIKQWCSYPDTTCPAPPAQRWGVLAGDGLARICVDQEIFDGGMPDGAAQPDAAVDGSTDDAPPLDAAPEVPCPMMPPVTSGQFADLVLGQADFESFLPNAAGASETGASLYFPWGAWSDGTHLWIGDNENARLLQWNSLPIANMQAADVAIGQPTMVSHASTTSQTQMATGGKYVFSDGIRLYVSDASNHRVLVWNAIPTTNGAPADVVLGQANFTTAMAGTSASGLNRPAGIWSDGTRLVVADQNNSRVLVWNEMPTSNGGPADLVLGQSDFGMNTVLATPTATSMKYPRGVYVDGSRLYVADTENHRVLAWNILPTANGAPADFVIGQGGFANGAANAGGAGANAAGLNFPHAMIAICSDLYIADSNNHRVVIHAPAPTTSGESADYVLGQDNLATGLLSSSTTQNRFNGPRGFAVAGHKLFVTDSYWSRVLRFDLFP